MVLGSSPIALAIVTLEGNGLLSFRHQYEAMCSRMFMSRGIKAERLLPLENHARDRGPTGLHKGGRPLLLVHADSGCVVRLQFLFGHRRSPIGRANRRAVLAGEHIGAQPAKIK